MELVRYFSFPYCFFDTGLRRTRYAILNIETDQGFPDAKDLIRDIEEQVNGVGIEVAFLGWQEFQNENDYRNFSN